MSIRNWILLGLLSVLWGGAFLFVDIALEGLPPLSIVFGRVFLAAVVLAFVLRALGQPFPTGLPHWRALGVMGLLNNAIPFSLFVFAQGQIIGSVAAILNATTPLFTMVVAHLVLRDERMTAGRLAGLAMNFAGVVVMMGGVKSAAVGWSMLACLIFFRLLAEAGAVNVSLVTFVIPVSAAVLGWQVLGHGLEPRHFAGFGLIALGLVAIDGRVGKWRTT